MYHQNRTKVSLLSCLKAIHSTSQCILNPTSGFLGAYMLFRISVRSDDCYLEMLPCI